MIARVVFTGLLVIYCVVDLVDSCKLSVSCSPEYELGDLKCVYCSLLGLKLRATAELSGEKWWEQSPPAYLQVEQVDPES